jgi:hypothetical protein
MTTHPPPARRAGRFKVVDQRADPIERRDFTSKVRTQCLSAHVCARSVRGWLKSETAADAAQRERCESVRADAAN